MAPYSHQPWRSPALARAAAVACLLVALVLGGLWWHAHQRARVTGPAGAGVPAASPTATGSHPTPTSATVPRATSPGCTTTTTPLVPTRLGVDRLHLDIPVLSVDAASSHGTMAPPTDQPWEAAWIDTTARPGSSVGAVNLSAHTYQRGGALGNLLYHDNPLRLGDVLRLSDAGGHRVCYRYTGSTTFRAADYDASSTLYYDPAASPELRLMVCWDKDARGVWESRVVFHATPLAP